MPPYAAGLTPSRSGAGRRLLRDSLVISLHDHPVRFPRRMEETPAYNRTGRQHAAYAGLAASGMTVVFDNMMDGTACVTGNAPWRWNDIITDLGMRQADLAHQREVMTIRTVADIDEAYRSGRVGPGVRAGGGHPDRERDRPAGRPVRPRAAADRDRLLRRERARQRPVRAGRRRPDRVRPPGGDPDEPARPGHRPVALLGPHRAGHLRAHQAPVLITHAGARAVWDIAADEARRRAAGRRARPAA